MSIISIGVSGLTAAQIALSTSSNNTTNAYTDGYTLQVATFSESSSGSGVEVSSVDRQYNQFVTTQLNNSISAESALSTYQTEIDQIDSLLADGDASLDTLMQSFFSSIQSLTSDASDTSAREEVIGSAETLASQFNQLGSYLDEMADDVNNQIDDQVTQINDITEQIADLNKKISLSSALGTTSNDLLDQRDLLVSQLSELVDVDVKTQDNGSYSISLSNGLALVSGNQSFDLTTTVSASDSTQTVIGYVDAAGNTTTLDDSTISGGSLGGLLEFRDTTLTETQNQLGLLAVSLTQAFNTLQESGIDLNGDTGTAFFSVDDPSAYGSTDNTGDATLSVTFSDDVSELSATDYTVSYSDTDGYTVTRNDSGASVDSTYDSDTGTLTFAGMSATISGTAADGDSFLVLPTRNAASSFSTLITDGSLIAAGTSTGSSDNTNALAMLDLQTSDIVGGTSTLSQTYSALVSDVGSTATKIAGQLETQTSLTEQLTTLQQSESGVNVDEEAANLILYQQYYQACAKVVEVGTTILDTVLDID
ncbi:flagellar hook-associated protein FlgK [Pseudomonas lijiangensis]|uniref:Flagellar hook-associated protein 1 n=1 Tax=Pseudomonas lijiangensis TaxID=2995658 RepID=A0ABX8HUQ1_9PSED|nr:MULTISPECIES: flagellar hook-associated protein FlgK [Pseudomonas syringae group]MBX8501130.1 flagellar hook-associated protein FlgK [Pseudomonas lijiangensis]MBX8505964.1 flagellar hook-associated protein FlgK [Pseudomonas lijiangensis]MBX8554097.1 flagellar hook-associated protein FlgK [Pseudomonas cichorii]QWU83171.1 flagellar hook-associated protein FlgK [Pseudomonas lijiangensis]